MGRYDFGEFIASKKASDEYEILQKSNSGIVGVVKRLKDVPDFISNIDAKEVYLSCTPEIHLPNMILYHWIGTPARKVKTELEKMRVQSKEALHYPFDNSHFFFDGNHSGSSVQFDLHDNDAYAPYIAEDDYTMGIYNPTGLHITSVRIGKYFTNKTLQEVHHIIEHVEEGELMCSACKCWTKDYKTYSFAGVVCTECYEPTTHLQPNTVGD